MRTVLTCVLVGIGGCGVPPASHDVVARVAAPDGQTDAIIIESNGGATTSFWYDICFAPHAGTCTARDSVAMLYGAGRNDYASGINVRWDGANVLIVEYQTAKSTKVSESPMSPLGQPIAVKLRPGIVDSDAPPGSMLDNANAL